MEFRWTSASGRRKHFCKRYYIKQRSTRVYSLRLQLPIQNLTHYLTKVSWAGFRITYSWILVHLTWWWFLSCAVWISICTAYPPRETWTIPDWSRMTMERIPGMAHFPHCLNILWLLCNYYVKFTALTVTVWLKVCLHVRICISTRVRYYYNRHCLALYQWWRGEWQIEWVMVPFCPLFIDTMLNINSG